MTIYTINYRNGYVFHHIKQGNRGILWFFGIFLAECYRYAKIGWNNMINHLTSSFIIRNNTVNTWIHQFSCLCIGHYVLGFFWELRKDTKMLEVLLSC